MKSVEVVINKPSKSIVTVRCKEEWDLETTNIIPAPEEEILL
jgi:hypothetical protein